MMKTITLKLNGDDVVEYDRENDDLDTINKIIDDWIYEGMTGISYEVL